MLLLATLLASCSSDNFKIDGELTHLNGTAVKIVFRGDSGIVNEFANLDKKGKFSFEGASAAPVLVSIMDQRGELLKRVVATNGDHLKLKGDASKGMAIKVKGNHINDLRVSPVSTPSERCYRHLRWTMVVPSLPAIGTIRMPSKSMMARSVSCL